MKKLLIAVFGLLILNCGGAESNFEFGTGVKVWKTLPVYVDTDFPEADQEVYDVYEDVFGAPIFAVADDEHEADCFFTYPDQIEGDYDLFDDPVGITFIATYGNRSTCSIQIESDLEVGEKLYTWVVAHELGHSLGFGHNDNVHSLMYPDGSFRTLDPSDLQEEPFFSQVCEVYSPNGELPNCP